MQNGKQHQQRHGEKVSVTAEKLLTSTWKQKGKQEDLEVELDVIQ